jgi:pimeloyl-ACP methyl ester carboxylesterase
MPRAIAVFKSPHGESETVLAYAAVLAQWPVPYEELDLPTRFGATHVIACGPPGAKPIVLLHGQDSSATSWIHNIADFSRAFRVYAGDRMADTLPAT